MFLLQLFEGADEVGDASDADVLGGSGGGLGDGGGDGSGAALGQDDAVDSGTLGGAKERPEIVGVLNAVEGEEETVLAFRFWLQEIFDAEKLALFNYCQDALMGVGAGDPGELVAGFERDADACGAAELDEPLEAVIATLAGYADVVERAGTGADGFFDWVKAVQNFHI
jgi:hypothetical protein